MILTCPSCATRYFADDASIGASGRSVRCAGCANTWFVEPQLELRDRAADVADTEPEPVLTRERVERMRRAADAQRTDRLSTAAQLRQRQTQRIQRGRLRAAAMAWGGAGVALAATTTSAVAFRDEVTKIFPKAASAYAAIGLDVNVFGLEFANLEVSHAFDGPNPVLVVRGEVSNLGHQDKPAPVLRFGLRNAESVEIQHVFAHMTQASIAPGASAPFEVRIEDSSPDAADLEATFGSMMAAPQGALVASSEGGGAPLLDTPAVEGLLRLETLAPSAGHAGEEADGLAPRLKDAGIG